MSNEFRLVPVEPTAGMREAFHLANDEYEDGDGESPDHQWSAMLAAAPQPPALGGEAETLAYLVRDSRDGQYSAHRCDPRGWAHGYQIKELIDRAHLAPLQAEIERLGSHGEIAQMVEESLRVEVDQLKAHRDELEALLLDIDDLLDREEISPGYDIELRISKVFTARAERAALSKPSGSENVCNLCRGEGRVGGPAPDEGGGKNCGLCDGTGMEVNS